MCIPDLHSELLSDLYIRTIPDSIIYLEPKRMFHSKSRYLIQSNSVSSLLLSSLGVLRVRRAPLLPAWFVPSSPDET